MLRILLTLFFSINLYAQVSPLSDVDLDRRIFMPRSLGLSGNLTARISLNESIYFNPASSAHSRCFAFEGGYGWQHHSDIDGRISNLFFNAIDTSNPLIGGGLAYSRKKLGTQGVESEYKGMLNKVFLNNRLGVGLGLSYFKFDHQDIKNDNFNLDFGSLFLLTQTTLIGFTASNILDDDSKIKTRQASLGVRQTLLQFFSFSMDFIHRFNKKTLIGAAFEAIDNNGLMFSLSMNRNQLHHQTFWGLGLGYIAPKISVLYGTMNAASYPFNFSHSLSIRIFW